MKFKLVNPQNFWVSGRKDREAADAAFEAIRAIIKSISSSWKDRLYDQ